MDYDLLKNVTNMGNDEISSKLSEITTALGINETTVRRMLGSPEDIRRKISKLSPADIEKMSTLLNKEQLDQIRKSLGGDENG